MFITKKEKKRHLCAAHQGTWEIHPTAHPFVGGVARTGGRRARQAAAEASVAGVAAGQASTAFRQRR